MAKALATLVFLVIAGTAVGCTALVAPDPGRLEDPNADTGVVAMDGGAIDDGGSSEVDAFSTEDAGQEDAFSAACVPDCTDGRTCVDGTCRCPDGVCCGGCGADQACLAGACVPCGEENQVCCGDRCVSADAVCSGGRCAHCGDSGEVCCGDGGCRGGADCEEGMCRGTCGEVGQDCCGSDRCAPGAVCRDGFPFGGSSCVACGGRDQPCCDGGVCGVAGLICDGGTCRGCGGAFEACCPGGGCRDGRRCSFDRCM